MSIPVRVECWPEDGPGTQALDLVCGTCGGRSRLHPRDRFVEQVRIFLEQHPHRDADELPPEGR